MRRPWFAAIFAAVALLGNASGQDANISRLVITPTSYTMIPDETIEFSLKISPAVSPALVLHFVDTDDFRVEKKELRLSGSKEAKLNVTALEPANEVFLEVDKCEVEGGAEGEKCPIDLSTSFARLRIIRSHALDTIVDVVGWLYFVAWSVSFYPQIILNFKRMSVAGLNFDFVLLNTIGFTAYTVYNCLIYFNPTVQAAYKVSFPRSPLPVLLNDVVFAAHALAACIVTGLQAIFLERGSQRVSRICIGWSVILLAFGAISGVLAATRVLVLLRFVDFLSYIKMAVTLSKYFPQAIFNWRRKSTVGWSIGNILLDLTGGTLDLLQMALQGINVANFSAIMGNPVKFGLGFVSIVFDIFFMIQHYVLYRGAEVVHAEYSHVDEESAGIVNEGADADVVPAYGGVASGSEDAHDTAPLG